MPDTKAKRAAFDKVFLENAWGSKTNAGKSYKRPYSKTKKA